MLRVDQPPHETRGVREDLRQLQSYTPPHSDTELAAGADDPHRDLATVGDQDLLQWLGLGLRLGAAGHACSWVSRIVR